MRMNTKAIVVRESVSRPRKKRSDVQRSQMEILSGYNVPNPEELLQQLEEASKGIPVTKQTVKFSCIVPKDVNEFSF